MLFPRIMMPVARLVNSRGPAMEIPMPAVS